MYSEIIRPFYLFLLIAFGESHELISRELKTDALNDKKPHDLKFHVHWKEMMSKFNYK